MALFLSWCIRIDAGRTGAKGQDVRLLLRHRQGQGLIASANPSAKWRLKSGAQRTETRITHKFVQTQKHANPLKTNGIPQTHRFAGFHFFVRWLQSGYFHFPARTRIQRSKSGSERIKSRFCARSVEQRYIISQVDIRLIVYIF